MSGGGEIAVLGLGKSGKAVSELLVRKGFKVYASDAESHDLGRIAKAIEIIVSPGVPPEAAPLKIAKENKIPVVSELEVALRYLPGLKYIAVTGTNGKTTTTSLIGILLRSLGYDAVNAGNIGTPLSEVAMRDKLPDWVALEVSSFQLHDTPSIKPNVGVLTNLSPDHLDRYGSVEEYYADKELMFANAESSSKWVLNADDERVMRMGKSYAGAQFSFSVKSKADAYYDNSNLVLFGHKLMPRASLPLFGDHNVANALAALLAVSVADDKHKTVESRCVMADALKSARPLPHRMELVGERNGVQWINDSKATNVSSALVAVSGMTRPTILLLGGRHKGEPYTPLSDAIRSHVKTIIAYGEAAEEIVHDLAGIAPIEKLGSSFEEVISRARELAERGDTVLLSPACSSYDMFNNYEERGAAFREMI